MLKKALAITLVFSVFLFILLFANVNFASAQSSVDSQDCEAQSTPSTLEILRFGLTPSLRMTNGVGFSPSLKDSGAGIPSPSLNADSDKELSEDGSRVAMFRLYNQWTGEHFYTSSISERDTIAKAGWKKEGTGWYAPTSENFKPVYRLYNPYVDGGDHHYTISADEKDACVKAGWSYEGEGWRTVDEGVTDYVKVLRQYNPYATTGTHHYTTSTDEQDNLVKAGWKAEGLGWGGYSSLEPSTQAIDFSKAVVDQSPKTYCAKQITPSATVTGLTKGTDYTVTYGVNKEVGTGTITIAGKGAYTGSQSWTFTINPLNISTKSTVTLGTSLTYTSKQQTQTVSKVVASNITLATSDYTVSNNTQTNAGTYTLRVTGKGNFTGVATKTFTVSPMNIKGASVDLNGSGQFTYDGTEHVQEVSEVTINGLKLSSSDYEVKNNKQTKAGTHSLEVVGKGNFTGTATKEFVIDKKVVKIANVTAKNKPYDGTDVAEADVSGATLDSLCEGDQVSVKSATGVFTTGKNVGTGLAVTLTDFELEDEDAENYQVVAPEDLGLTANITQKEVTVTGLKVKERVYEEGNKKCDLVGSTTFADGDICVGDTIVITNVRWSDYADANAGDDKPVTLTFVTGGYDARNYVISESSKTIKGNVLAIVKFDTNYSTTIEDQYAHVGKPFDDTVTSQLPTRDGLTKEGWYNNAACATDEANNKFKWDFSTNYVTDNITTLYANWTPTKDSETGNLSYWLAPSYKVTSGNTKDTANQGNNAADKSFARDSYVTEEWNVLKSSKEIQEDIKKIKANDATTINEYNTIMANDKYHLYTVYNGGENEESNTGTTSALNHYVEARVVQVGSHLNIAGDSSTADGSTLTFMAICLLPTAYQMHHEDDNAGGWSVMDFRTLLQEGDNGTIYNKFNPSFTGDVANIAKFCHPGGSETDRTKYYKSENKLWLFSNTECQGKGSLNVRSATNEGSAYQWFVNTGVDASTDSGNYAFLSTEYTRSYEVPGSKDEGYGGSWSRTPFLYQGGTSWYQPYCNMTFSSFNYWCHLSYKIGIVLGFAF